MTLLELPGHQFAEDEIELGYVSGFFGVRGELRLFLHNPSSDFFRKPRGVTFVDEKGGRFSGQLRARQGAGKRIIGRIEGVASRNDAERFLKWRFGIKKAELPQIDDDSFYVHDLIGRGVIVDGERIGDIVDVHSTQQNDVFEIAIGEDLVFIPMLNQFIVELNPGEDTVSLSPEAFEE